MPIGLLSLIVIAIFIAAYRLYGLKIKQKLQGENTRLTPACLSPSGDCVPTPVSILLPQHFSAIAAAGPIVGPILAGMGFGWLPALLWIVLGNITIGAVHDFAILMASVRHGGRSIIEVVRAEMGRHAHVLFLLFVWISLIYVIVAFTDLTASTFTMKDGGGGVASSSLLYLALSCLLGWALSRMKCPEALAMVVGLLLLGVIIVFGKEIPLVLPVSRPEKIWGVLILLYCAVASVLPVWLLLQPRGALGGYFLYLSLMVGVVGLLFGGYPTAYPAFIGFQNAKGESLFPLLFITVACGACSGFHGLVCSGTTSKQLAKEEDARPIGYGGMLLEGLVAVIALATVMILPVGDPALKQGPTAIYAQGLARFAHVIGVPMDVAIGFGLLALNTFVFDTLDVATRLGRYIIEELTGWKGRSGYIAATLVTVAPPLFFLLTTKEQAYKVFWPLFGASNQLLAAMGLLGVSVWLKKEGHRACFTLIPTAFLLMVTLWSLVGFVQQGGIHQMVAVILLGLALALMWISFRQMTRVQSS